MNANKGISYSLSDSVPRCRLCGARLHRMADDLHDARYGLLGKYNVLYCQSCGLGETYPKVSPGRLPALYEEVIGDRPAPWWRRLYRRCRRSPMGVAVRARLDRAGQFLMVFPPSSRYPRLLDVGCGVGDSLVLFRALGFKVQGIDLNPRVVEVAQTRGLDVHCQPVEELAQRTESICDVVVLSHLLEHVTDPLSVLESIGRILRPGGKLVVAVPNLNSRYRIRYGPHWINWYMPFHIFHFTEMSLRLVLERSGFVVERVIDYTPPYSWLGSVIVHWFDRYGVPNRKAGAWWHQLLFPLLVPLLAVTDRVSAPGTGDYLCSVARKGSCE